MWLYHLMQFPAVIRMVINPVLCPRLTLIQPTWSAYPYRLVFLIWYQYSLAFLIWYPYALTSLYGNTAHCSWYGIAMGCYGLFIVPKTAIVTSQWYDRNCFTEYARTWVRHPTTPWQRECMAITDRQLINSSLDSMRFVTHFWETTPYILRDAIIVLVQSKCYSINADFPQDVCLTVSRNHTVFLFSQLILTSTENYKSAMYLTAQYCFTFELIYHQSINPESLKNTVATIVSLRPERDRNNFKSIFFIDNFQIWIGIFNWSLFLRTNWQ